jgi:hypothetical protein
VTDLLTRWNAALNGVVWGPPMLVLLMSSSNARPRRFGPERCCSTSDALMEPQERRTEYRIMRRVGDGCATWRNPASLKVPASPMLANAGG